MYWAINSLRTTTERPGAGAGGDRPAITTTLYHLIAGLQARITAEHDDLLVAVVHHLIGTGRIKVLSEGCDWPRDADGPDIDA